MDTLGFNCLKIVNVPCRTNTSWSLRRNRSRCYVRASCGNGPGVVTESMDTVCDAAEGFFPCEEDLYTIGCMRRIHSGPLSDISAAYVAGVGRFYGRGVHYCVDARECWISAQVDVPVHRFPEVDLAFVGTDDSEPTGWRRTCAVHGRLAATKAMKARQTRCFIVQSQSDLKGQGCRCVVGRSFFGSKRKGGTPRKGQKVHRYMSFDALTRPTDATADGRLRSSGQHLGSCLSEVTRNARAARSLQIRRCVCRLRSV